MSTPTVTAPKPGQPAASAPKDADPKATETKKTERRPTPKIDDLDVEAIVSQATHAAPVLREEAQPQRERKPAQLAMDKVVKRAHEDWAKQGKPGAWSKIVPVTYFLDAGKTEAYKYLIRRAADFHGVRVRFGTPFRLTAEMAKKAGRPETDAGKEVLTFAIMDKTRQDKKPADKTDNQPATAAK